MSPSDPSSMRAESTAKSTHSTYIHDTNSACSGASDWVATTTWPTEVAGGNWVDLIPLMPCKGNSQDLVSRIYKWLNECHDASHKADKETMAREYDGKGMARGDDGKGDGEGR